MKRFLTVFLAVVFIVSAAAGLSEAQAVQRLTYMYGGEPHFSVDLTNLWNLEMVDGDVIGISDDGKIWFFLGDVLGQTQIDGAMAKVTATMTEYLDNIEVMEKLDEFNLNGLKARALQGTAKQKGKDVVFFVLLFKTEADNIGTIVFVMDPAAEELHLDQMLFLARSVSRR